MMKKITLFLAICLSFMAQDLVAQCIPASVRPVFGTVTGSTGTQTFNNVPTGNVVRITAPAAGTFYTISMCSTNGGVAQADGIDDSQLTVLNVNSAAAVDLAFNDDFCPTTGPNGYGPSEVSYTATAAGDIFVYLTEWDAGGANQCIADGVNTSYTMTVAISSAPPVCEAGTLTSPLTQIVCPGQTGTIATTGNSTPGDYSVGFVPGVTGIGGNGVGFTITGIATLPYTFDDDLNGTLSANALPVLEGEWILTLFATDAGVNCDSTVTTSVTFADATDPACGGTGIDAEITSVDFSEYTSIPLSQAGTYSPSLVVTNIGASTVTNVTAAVTVLDGANAVVYTASMNTVPSLAAAASTPLTDGGLGFTPSAIDFYLVEYVISITEVDGNTLNDTSFTALNVTDSLFTRDFAALIGAGGITGALGIGAGGTVTVGNVIDIVNPTDLVNIQGFFNGTMAIGDTVTAKLHAFSGTTVGAQLASIQKVITPADTPVFFLEFDVNQTLAAGSYYVAIEEAFSVDNMGLQYSPDVYTVDKIQGNINGGAFSDLETLAGPAFRVVPLVWANIYAPPVVNCAISNLSAGAQTSCIPATNEYTQDVTVTFTNPPGSGMLNVNGQMFAIGTSPQTVTLTGLDSDGLSVNVTAAFTADAGCTLTQNALFTAPANCTPVCTISALAAGAQTACVNTTNNYTQEVVVTYTTPPASGMLNVNGQMFAIGTSPQTVILTGLDSDGLAVNVTASFTAAAACTLTSNALFTAPASCLCPTVSVNVMTTDVTNCASPDGSAMANASGGQTPYTYVWTPSTFGNGQTIMNIPSGTYSVVATDANGCSGNGSGSVANTSGVNALISGTMNVSCPGGNDGAISITPSGGTGTISYTWSDQGFGSTVSSRTDLIAGSYTIVVSDAGSCSVTLGPIVISQPNPISITLANSSNISCNGLTDGQINMDVSGGTGGYTYAWSGSTSTMEDLSNLGVGAYQLTVTDANSCTSVGPMVNITQPMALSLSTNSPSDVSCNAANDGSFIAVANGGTAPYMFSANGGTPQGNGNFGGLSGNTYTPTVTDANGCTASAAPVAIIEPAAIVVSIDASSNISCNGEDDGSIDVTVTGAQGALIYNWGAGNPTTEDLSLLGPGAYVLNVTDGNGCTASSSSTSISEPALLVLATSSTEETSSAAGDGTATVAGSGGTAPYTYLWDDASAQTTATASTLNTGTYNVTVTDANGCSEMASVFVDLGSAIKEITLQDFTVYPNPANKNVVVTFEVQKNTDLSINFYNTIGNLLMSDKASVTSVYKKSFDISNLAAGIYFVEIQSEAGKAIKKLTVGK